MNNLKISNLKNVLLLFSSVVSVIFGSRVYWISLINLKKIRYRYYICFFSAITVIIYMYSIEIMVNKFFITPIGEHAYRVCTAFDYSFLRRVINWTR